MYTIKKNVENEIIVNKSRFITYLFKVHSKAEVDSLISKLKREHKEATHYCYAYVIGSNIKCSDDGEPSKTAGAPLLNVLEKNKLNHVVAIVIRYFGGVKLGAGGLVRAYTKSVTECLKLTEIIKTSTGYLVEISFDHSDIKQVDFLLKDVEVNKTYDDNVTYTFCIQKNDFDLISDKLKSYIISMKIIEDIYV